MLNATASGQNPYSIHLNKSNGLPCNEIYNLHQDKRGFIWIASDLGLYRYDGFEYKGYFTSNMSSKSGSYIREDEKGRIWYSTFDARLYYVEKDSLKPFASENGLSQNVEFAIIDNKVITIGREDFLLFSEINSGHIIQKIPLPPTYSSLYPLDQYCLVGFGSTVQLYNSQGKKISTLYAEAGNNIYKIASFEGKYYSVEIGKGATTIYEINKQSKKLLYSEPYRTSIHGLYRIDNQLFILKKDGLTRFNLISHESNTQILQGISTSHVIKDTGGNLWISSPFEGISIFPSAASLESYALPLSNCKIRMLDNELLLFNGEGLIYTFNLLNHTFQNILTDKNKASIYDVVPFSTGNLEGLYEDHNLSILPYKNQTLMVLKSGLKEIKQIDQKYIATASTGAAGMIRLNNMTLSAWDSIALNYQDTVFEKNSMLVHFLQNIRTKSLCFDSNSKTLYYASNVGVYTATPNKVSELLYKQQKIYASKVFHRKGQTLFFLNSGELLSRTKIGEVALDTALNLNAPYQFVKIQDSLLFLGTDKELFYVNLDSKALSFRQIPFSDVPSELNDIVSYQNYFLFSINNLLIKTPKENDAVPSNIPFYINYIESKSGKHDAKSPIQFASTESDLKINFSVLDYFHANPSILYKINNGIWRKVDATTRTITLASLSPDDYSISFSINGKIYENLLRFSINQKWYLRWWFLSLVVLAVLSLIYLYYKGRLRNSQKESNLLLEKANLEKDLRQSMLSGIKSQMNPHFLFNALNTIQSYIVTEEKTKASNYLSKFSKLTRKILEMSDRETVTLQEEVDTLVLYIDLEKMRFQELNYVIEIDKNIDCKKIWIPSMIIQPYVENAIKHGLLHKEGDKQLFIRMSAVEKILLIHIEDNGIGRKQSAAINNSKHHNHSSFATQANRKRVELLNTERNEIAIEYIDKVDIQGNACGTSITIKIPIK